MMVEFTRNELLHSFANVSLIREADKYILLEPIHDVIKYYINGVWVNNCEAITVIKDFTDMRVLI